VSGLVAKWLQKAPRKNQVFGKISRQAVALVLVAAIPSATLPVDTSSFGSMRQVRAAQSLNSFLLPALDSDKVNGPGIGLDQAPGLVAGSSLSASASRSSATSLAARNPAHPMAMPQSITNAAVTPILECVRNNGGGSPYTAWFGYENDNTRRPQD
jgi:hypothetical protein